MKKTTYRQAGVDIGKYERLIPFIKRQLEGASERSRSGLFAGVLDLGKYGRSERLVVASVDGVGTKVRVANEYGRHVGIGKDIVAHCVNDILCMGARPVGFMDYIAFARLDTVIFKQVMRGIASECKANGIELIGGGLAGRPAVVVADQEDRFAARILQVARLLSGSAQEALGG